MISVLFVSILISGLILVLGIEKDRRMRAVRVEVKRHKPKTRR